MDESLRQLTKNAGDLHQYPNVSPDGKTIFFNSNRSGTNHIWRMDISGANQAQVTFGEKDVELHPQISPDGASLYYIRKSPNASTINRKSLTDEKIETLTEEGNFAPDSFLTLSPDGKFLAFHNRREKVSEEGEKRNYQIVVIPTGGGEAPKFFNLPASRLVVHWTNDSSALDYIENDPEGARIWRQPLDARKPPTPVIFLPKSFLHNFAWSANGERLALSRGQQLNDAILLTNFQP
jgi:Tol biopolymer transport system component